MCSSDLVERSRKELVRGEGVLLSIGTEEVERFVAAEFVFDPRAAAKVAQARAAAHADVLTMIDQFAARRFAIRRSPAAKCPPCFE